MRIAGFLLALTAGPLLAEDRPPSLPDRPAFDRAALDDCLQSPGPEGAASCIGLAASACSQGPGGATTVGTAQCLEGEHAIWQSRMDDAYARLKVQATSIDREMDVLGSATEKQVPLLEQMQRDWAAYRDAACAFERSRWGSGTGGGPAAIHCNLTLTARHSLWLETYLQQ